MSVLAISLILFIIGIPVSLLIGRMISNQDEDSQDDEEYDGCNGGSISRDTDQNFVSCFGSDRHIEMQLDRQRRKIDR